MKHLKRLILLLGLFPTLVLAQQTCRDALVYDLQGNVKNCRLQQLYSEADNQTSFFAFKPGGDEITKHPRTKRRDGAGRVTYMQHANEADENDTGSYQAEYSYGSNGRLSQIKVTDTFDNALDAFSRVFTYGSNGQVTREELIDDSGTWSIDYHVEDVDDHGNWTKRTGTIHYNSDEEMSVTETRTIEYYDDATLASISADDEAASAAEAEALSTAEAYGYEQQQPPNIITHTLQRGESLEILAERYGTKVEAIRALNDLDVVFTGMELQIPVPVASESRLMASGSNGGDSAYEMEVEAADLLLSQRDYKKAEKAYTGIMKRYGGADNCIDALYGRAICHYNRGKWKAAIKDLDALVNNANCSPAISEHGRELLATAYQKRQEQREERFQAWGSFISTAISTAADVYVAVETNKQQARAAKNAAKSGGSASSSGGGSDDDDDDGGYSASSSSSSSKRKGCSKCGTTSSCGVCNGDGHYLDTSFGLDQERKCTHCNGSGLCPKNN